MDEVFGAVHPDVREKIGAAKPPPQMSLAKAIRPKRVSLFDLSAALERERQEGRRNRDAVVEHIVDVAAFEETIGGGALNGLDQADQRGGTSGIGDANKRNLHRGTGMD